MHRRVGPQVASCSPRAPPLSRRRSRSRCRSRPTPTMSHRHPCPPTSRCERGTRRSSWVTPLAPRTTSACPQALASPLRSSRRRPLCSATMRSKSPPTSSAPTRLRTTRIQRWWPLARSEEHTSELQSRLHLVCRLLLEKKNNKQNIVLLRPRTTQDSSSHQHGSLPVQR